ncbi:MULTISPECIES: DUF1672 family protein [Bacillus]|uniref:DUF1672 family protein n=1 Tax=Bacillus TaxID=1386 RepID=UPI000308BC57|nr:MULTISPECIES: DUF1672 family protein [Bacillus]
MHLRKSSIIVLGMGVSLLLGGCGMNETKDRNEPNVETVNSKPSKEDYSVNFVRIQDYKGEGYTLRNSGTETSKIAKKNKPEIEIAVKKFFKETYKTKVKVHNIVGAKDGASVFVESIGEPHFYTFAIVPIDVEKQEVKIDEVWSQEGQVEHAIKGALYAMIFDQEFANLDSYFDNAINKYPIVGTPSEAIQKVGGDGYATPFYFINTLGDWFEEVYQKYIENPAISKQDLKKMITKKDFQSDSVIVTINLYMKEADVNPDQTVFNNVVDDIERMNGLPKGAYTVLLHDNKIDRRRAIGSKENTLERSTPNEIMKN